MKVLLFIPEKYTIAGTLIQGFTALGYEVISIDYREYYAEWVSKIKRRTSKLNNKLKENIDDLYIKKINNKHLEKYLSHDPVDIVLIYNHELFLPETIRKIKHRSKVIFYLADSPYYSPGNDYSLTILKDADLIASPDTFWNKQISSLGFKNVIFSILGYDKVKNYKYKPTKEEYGKYSNDVVFIGTNYKSSWGYKRAHFLNQFSDLDLKIYAHGPSWKTWRNQFPVLEKSIEFRTGRMSYVELNTILNCCKIYPVDANPGLLNGLHIRIFDCIASGILPVIEYREDLNTVFNGLEIPVIKNYKYAKRIANYYLKDENKRVNVIKSLKEFIEDKYSPEKSIKHLISKL
jgi:hypothetical protein